MFVGTWSRTKAACASTNLRHTAKGGSLSKYQLKLYVVGSTGRAKTAITNLRRLCEKELSEEYELQIIDVLEHPELAEADRIIATPTLIKNLPLPLRRVIGDMSDTEKVLLGLHLSPRAPDRDGQR